MSSFSLSPSNTNELPLAPLVTATAALFEAEPELLTRRVVTDDGVGFCPERATESTTAGTGFGLSSMRQRAMAVGGELEVRSAPGAGTEVRFSVLVKAGEIAPAEGVQNGNDQAAHRRG